MENYWIKQGRHNQYLRRILNTFEPDLWLEWEMISKANQFPISETDLRSAMRRLISRGEVSHCFAKGAIVLELFRIK